MAYNPAKKFVKEQLTEGTHNLTITQATVESDNRIEVLFGSEKIDGLASMSVLPEQYDWVLANWAKKLGLEFFVDQDFKNESGFASFVAETIATLKGKGNYFSINAVRAKDKAGKLLPPRNGKYLFNGSFA